MYCIAPLSSLGFAAAETLASMGLESTILDDYGRCIGLLDVEVDKRIRLVDAPPGSKQASRILRKCSVLLLAFDPWDAGGCGGWERLLTGYLLEALRAGVDRLVVGLPAGAYAWSTSRVDCSGLPVQAPRHPVYGWPLGVAVAALSARPDTLVVVYPPLLHLDSRVLEGSPEPLNWFERLVLTRVLEAEEDAVLTVLDYRDAGETLAVLLEGVEVGLWCMGGVEVGARDAASLAAQRVLRRGFPSSLVVVGEGVKRRTIALLRRLGVHKG